MPNPRTHPHIARIRKEMSQTALVNPGFSFFAFDIKQLFLHYPTEAYFWLQKLQYETQYKIHLPHAADHKPPQYPVTLKQLKCSSLRNSVLCA